MNATFPVDGTVNATFLGIVEVVEGDTPTHALSISVDGVERKILLRYEWTRNVDNFYIIKAAILYQPIVTPQCFPVGVLNGVWEVSVYKFIQIMEMYSKLPITLDICLGWHLIGNTTIPPFDSGCGLFEFPKPWILMDDVSIASYKLSFLSSDTGHWRVIGDPDPICMIISCLSVSKNFVRMYKTYLNSRIEDIKSRCNRMTVGAPEVDHIPPWDVCIGLGVMYLMSVHNSFTSDNWTIFHADRVKGLQEACGRPSWFRMLLPLEKVVSITTRIKSIPGFMKFVGSLLTNAWSGDTRIDNYLKRSCAWKGMRHFKLAMDFLNEPLTLAHIQFVRSDDITRFRKMVKDFEDRHVDPQFAAFTNPEMVLPVAEYLSLAKVARDCKMLSRESCKHLVRGVYFKSLREYYQVKI